MLSRNINDGGLDLVHMCGTLGTFAGQLGSEKLEAAGVVLPEMLTMSH